MSLDVEVLELWVLGCVVLASFFTTLFPAMYLFSAWTSTPLGRILMLQGIAFALAIDLTLTFAFWRPDNIHVVLFVNAFVFTFIAASTGALCVMLWRANYSKKARRKYKNGETNQDEKEKV